MIITRHTDGTLSLNDLSRAEVDLIKSGLGVFFSEYSDVNAQDLWHSMGGMDEWKVAEIKD